MNRLCAVYGGVYCLKQSLKSIITNSEKYTIIIIIVINKIVVFNFFYSIATGIICASGQRIKCMYVLIAIIAIIMTINIILIIGN